MTARLREALHQAAADVPTYGVYERAIATARRSRRRTAAAVAALVVVCALVLVWLPTPAAQIADAPAEPTAALPDRIGVQVIGALHATDWPRPGTAAVVFSGTAAGLTGWDEDTAVGLVGADADRYRVLKVEREVAAGEQVLLSPDGRHVAYPPGRADRPSTSSIWSPAAFDTWPARYREARPPRRSAGPATGAGWSCAPLCQPWPFVPTVSADGQSPGDRPANPERRDGYESVLSVVELDSGRWVRLRSERTGDGNDQGSAVAFAPDQRRLAYQTGSVVAVMDVEGNWVSSFGIPPDSALAGKGAWTSDGTALTLVARRGDAWVLRYVDPTTGEETPGRAMPSVTGVAAIRLLGWGPDGSAVVVAYQPEPRSPTRFDQPLSMDQRTSYGNVRTVRVLALTPGATTPTTLLTAPDQVLAIDVADSVVASGRTRRAHPPLRVGPRFWLWTGLGCVLAVGAALIWRRRRLASAIPGVGRR